MSAFKDISNQVFGSWQVINFDSLNSHSDAMWRCRCNLCGRIKTLTAHSLISGRSTKCRSCATRISHSRDFSNDPIKIVFQGMKQRCYNSNVRSYKNYGAKGITICDEWLENPTLFYEWAYDNGYSKGLSIERKNVHQGYSPSNCTFIPKSEQSKNRNMSHMISIKGKTLCLSDWCRIYNIKAPTVMARYNKGMSWEDALSKPVNKNYAHRKSP